MSVSGGYAAKKCRVPYWEVSDEALELRRLRKDLRITLRVAARALGLRGSQLTALETGESALPEHNDWLAVFDVLRAIRRAQPIVVAKWPRKRVL
jgi:hypothetical protein